MSPHQILDALSASFFALLGLWAGVVQRHWFLRFVVVCVCLLAALLIPAYEVVIEFGILIAVVTSGVWLARSRDHWRLQWSLETVLLLTVVVAVISAVAAKAPELDAHEWSWMLVNGIAPGLLALGCLWLLTGQGSWHRRLLIAAIGFVPFLVFYHLLRGLESVVVAVQNDDNWQAQLRSRYQWDHLVRWTVWNVPTIALSIAMLVPCIWLARQSGWFARDKQGDLADQSSTAQSSMSRTVARATLVAALMTVTIPLIAVFILLLNPPDYPVVELPQPNGYDDFVAAGKRIDEPAQVTYSNWQSMKDQDRPALVATWQPVIEQVRQGLQKKCYWPLPASEPLDSTRTLDLLAPIHKVNVILSCALEYEAYSGKPEVALDLAMLHLRFGQEIQRGTANRHRVGYDPSEFNMSLGMLLPRLTAKQCTTSSERILSTIKRQESIETIIQRMKVAESNKDWQSHLGILMKDSSGAEAFAWERKNYNYWVAKYRLWSVHLALQAYWLEESELPKSLDAIVPKQLVSVPLDPFTQRPLVYHREPDGQSYTVLSPGPNKVVEAIEWKDKHGNPITAADDVYLKGPAKSTSEEDQ